MDTQHLLPITTILLMGAFHGINPGMGWLFAVALGMQERRIGAVWRALVPLTIGHGLAIAVVVLIAIAAGIAVPAASMKIPVAVILATLGIYRLVRHTHFSGSGMRVGFSGLTAWSFLMASCHGAGLMVLPLFLGMAAPEGGAMCHSTAAASTTASMAVTSTVAHGLGYLVVTAAIAWLVFTKLGVTTRAELAATATRRRAHG